MTKTKPSHWFDKDIHMLGEACPSKHYWGTSLFSLRFRYGGECVECNKKTKKARTVNVNNPELQEQFMSKVKKTASCWIWVGYRKQDINLRYGVFRVGKGLRTAAHRCAYLIFVGEIPPGKVVKHRCGQSLCVNPSHLYLADPIQNILSS